VNPREPAVGEAWASDTKISLLLAVNQKSTNIGRDVPRRNEVGMWPKCLLYNNLLRICRFFPAFAKDLGLTLEAARLH